MIPTITFSNEILVFQKGSQECNFLINNNSKDIIVYFKVKTTKLNTYEVKPAKGSIMPEQNKGIHFKIVQPLLNIEQV